MVLSIIFRLYTMKMEAEGISETLVGIYQTIQRYIAEDSNPHSHR
jgi:hypothetical protein